MKRNHSKGENMKHFLLGTLLASVLTCTNAQVESDLKVGDSTVAAITMGDGDHAVIALHGAGGNDRRFFFIDRGGQLGQELSKAGFRVIAPTWPGQAGMGFGEVATAIAYAKSTGAKKISLMGHSRGGELAANYAKQQPDGTFNTVIQLASVDDQGLPMAQTKKLFAFNKYDKWPQWQRSAYEKSAEPKQIIELGGSGHPVSALISEKADFAQDVIGILRK
jgi:pimeloyl-ACP methyl ester carboxylesterase